MSEPPRGDEFHRAFDTHHHVWGDCYLGFVVVEHASEGGHDALASCLESRGPFLFYPWLADGHEDLTLPAQGLREHDAGEAEALFLEMARDAIRHGSPERISDEDLRDLFQRFVGMFSSPRFFASFTPTSWRAVTGHARDSLLCVVDNARVGLWLSCDDE